MSEKPILFNTEMVRAILDGRKTMTRRIIKPQPEFESGFDYPHENEVGIYWKREESYSSVDELIKELIKRCPFGQPGDILWVRETWGVYTESWLDADGFVYKADYPAGAKGYWFEPEQINWCDLPIWRPSIHMPREAARLFLRLTNVRIERIQDITENDAKSEGIGLDAYISASKHGHRDDDNYSITNLKTLFAGLWDSIYAEPQLCTKNGVPTHYESYPWVDIRETRTYKGLPWKVFGNPWVRVTEFERTEADANV